MNNQLKLLIYIAFVVVIFLFIQDRFEIFDVSLINSLQEEDVNGSSKENPFLEEDPNVSSAEEGSKNDYNDDAYVEITKDSGVSTRVNVDIADSAEERELGLSGRRYLGDYDGMLFVFEKNTNSSFWMKDMYFPIDIIFIDSSGFITHIVENAQPCEDSSCPLISSNGWYRSVLEVNAGFCELNNVALGNGVSSYLD